MTGPQPEFTPHSQPIARRSQIWLLWLWDATGLDEESVKIPGINKTTHAKGVKTGQWVAVFLFFVLANKFGVVNTMVRPPALRYEVRCLE